MLRIRVPATSANLSVGFDVLGVSLSLYNTFTFVRSNKIELIGFASEYSKPVNNLLYKSYAYVFRHLECDIIPVKITGEFEIPIKRGLGSSSSLIVAGVFGANAMLGYPLDKDTLFNLCVAIEGHPDNVCPAIYGGLMSSLKKDDVYIPFSHKISDKLEFNALIPPYEVKTEDARIILPQVLPYNEIVHNLERLVLIPKAFKEGDVKLLISLFDDKLHEPYRGKLIKGFFEIKAALRRRGCASAISGSGSTILIISNKKINYSYLDYKFINLKISQGISVEEL